MNTGQMITGLKVETKHDDTRILRAIKAVKSDQSQYLVKLTPNAKGLQGGVSQVGEAVLISAGMDNPNLISYDFRLRRGLYDVVIETIVGIEGGQIRTDPESRYEYPEPVMVGQQYMVRAKLEDASSSGERGVRVRIQSTEVPLDEDMVYYIIDRENLKHVRYYVPFHQTDRIDFFIKGVQKDEVKLFLGNPSFQIQQI